MPRSFNVLLVPVVLTIGAVSAGAAPMGATAAPATAPVKTAAPVGLRQITSVEGITEYLLPNGLVVLLFPDSSKPTATVNVTYLVGSRQEGYGETGMAHLLEHMLFKGTPTHSNIPQELTAHGSRPNGSTEYDRTNYFETFTATDENLDWALDLESDRMVHSKVAKADLDSEMTVVRNEFESGENSPQQVLLERVMSTAYLWHNYGKSTIGSRADIERVPIERLQAFYRKWYQPDNAILVVAGKFEEPKVTRWITEKFGAIPRPTRPLEATYTVEPAQDGPREVTLRRVGDVRQAMLAYHVPAGSHPDFAAVEVLAYLLGNEPSGRLYKALVETKQASAVFSFAWQLKEPGMLIAAAELSKDHPIAPVRDTMLKVAEGFVQTPPTEQDIERARLALLRRWETTLRNSERAALVLSEWAAMGDWRLMFLHRDRLEQVKAADVTRVATAYLTANNRTEGIFEPTTAAERIEIPATPDVPALVAHYQGRAALQEGEAFNAAPRAIEERLTRTTVAGLKTALLPKHTRGATVQVSLSLSFGDADSLQGRAMAGWFAGEMLTRGTAHHSRQELHDAIDKLKAEVVVRGRVTRTTATLETTKDNLVPALRLIAEILREPAFPASEFDLLKQEQLTQIEDSRSDPTQKAMIAFSRHLNPWPAGDPRSTMTTDEHIAAIKAVELKDVHAFYRDFYGADAGELAIVGEFDPAAVTKVLHELFDGWQGHRAYRRLEDRYTDAAPTFEKIEAPDKENAFFLGGELLPLEDNDPDYPALVLGNFMMGGGFINSRLAVRIRQKDGLSYGVGSSLQASAFEPVGAWQAFAICAPQNADKLVAAVKEEVARALAQGFTPTEVAEAKKGWLQSRQVSRSVDRELARALTDRTYQSRTLTFDADLEAKVEQLTPEQVQAALKRHVDPARMSIVIAGDFAKAKTAASTPAAGSGKPEKR